MQHVLMVEPVQMKVIYIFEIYTDDAIGPWAFSPYSAHRCKQTQGEQRFFASVEAEAEDLRIMKARLETDRFEYSLNPCNAWHRHDFLTAT